MSLLSCFRRGYERLGENENTSCVNECADDNSRDIGHDDGPSDAEVSKYVKADSLRCLSGHADDAAAAALGVPIGGMYHKNGEIRIRIV